MRCQVTSHSPPLYFTVNCKCVSLAGDSDHELSPLSVIHSDSAEDMMEVEAETEESISFIDPVIDTEEDSMDGPAMTVEVDDDDAYNDDNEDKQEDSKFSYRGSQWRTRGWKVCGGIHN